jgi:hypothetical protein
VAPRDETEEVAIMNRRFFRLCCMLGAVATAVFALGAPLKW